jgi:hypothetical protein
VKARPSEGLVKGRPNHTCRVFNTYVRPKITHEARIQIATGLPVEGPTTCRPFQLSPRGLGETRVPLGGEGFVALQFVQENTADGQYEP